MKAIEREVVQFIDIIDRTQISNHITGFSYYAFRKLYRIFAIDQFSWVFKPRHPGQ